MQSESRARLIAIDETSIGGELREAGNLCCILSQLQERLRHWRPRPLRLGIDGIIGIALPVSNPAERAAVGHGNRHVETSRRYHVAEVRPCSDGKQRIKEQGFTLQGEAAQDRGAGPQAVAQGSLFRDVSEESPYHIFPPCPPTHQSIHP